MQFRWLVLFVIVGLAAVVKAESPLICSYVNIKGDFIELNWFPAINKGQEYVDYGRDKSGPCVLRASCGDNVKYETKIERCSDLNVTCDNQQTFDGEFPACCVKC